MRVIGKVKVWVTGYSNLGPEDINEEIDVGSTGLWYSNCHGMEGSGWTHVGDATITIDFVSHDVMVRKKIDALHKEAIGIMAEATARRTEIESKINQLLAIENKPSA